MKTKRPMLVTFIADLTLLNVFLMIVSFFPTPKFIEQSGFSFIPISDFSDVIFRILRVIILLIISYGFLKLKRWGYVAMIAYNYFFLVLSIIIVIAHIKQLSTMSNFIGSLLWLILTFPSKRYFIKENAPA
jgi:hypothetical protein